MAVSPKQHDSAVFSLALIDLTTEWIPPPTLSEDKAKIYPPYVSDREKENSLLSAIKSSAENSGLTKKNKSSREETENSKHRNTEFFSTNEPSVLYYGGAPGHEFLSVETITYFCGSVAAFVVFLRNALGAAKDWRDLRADREIVVQYGGKEVKIREGVDLEGVIKKIEKGAAPKSTPRGKTRRRPR